MISPRASARFREFCARFTSRGREVGLTTDPNLARDRREVGVVTIWTVDISSWPPDPDWDELDVPYPVPDPRDSPCAVLLLGPLRVYRTGQRVVGGWRLKSLELLAYLAVHPHGAAKDQILEALWPEGDPKETQSYLWHSVSHLRARLGETQSLAGRIVYKADDIYRLDMEHVWVDVLALDRAWQLADTRADPERYLRLACALCKGGFCEGRYYTWSTLFRERFSHLFLESARQLARHLEAVGDVDGALSILDRAIECDPYDEDLCRTAIVLEARRGRGDKVARRFKRLRRLLLEDLGCEPSTQTEKAMKRATETTRFVP